MVRSHELGSIRIQRTITQKLTSCHNDPGQLSLIKLKSIFVLSQFHPVHIFFSHFGRAKRPFNRFTAQKRRNIHY